MPCPIFAAVRSIAQRAQPSLDSLPSRRREDAVRVNAALDLSQPEKISAVIGGGGVGEPGVGPSKLSGNGNPGAQEGPYQLWCAEPKIIFTDRGRPPTCCGTIFATEGASASIRRAKPGIDTRRLVGGGKRRFLLNKYFEQFDIIMRIHSPEGASLDHKGLRVHTHQLGTSATSNILTVGQWKRARRGDGKRRS
jgi:hypothetical protein